MKATFCSVLLLITISCTQPSLVGEWKLQKVELEKGINERWPEGFVYDFENKEALRARLVKELHNKKDATNGIDSVLRKAEQLGLTVRSDSTYKMTHGSVFYPISYAGWFSTDDIVDKWLLKNDTLYLRMVRNDYLNETPFHVMYKVLDLDDDQLQIQELGVQEQKTIGRGMIEIETKPSMVITFQRKK